MCGSRSLLAPPRSVLTHPSPQPPSADPLPSFFHCHCLSQPVNPVAAQLTRPPSLERLYPPLNTLAVEPAISLLTSCLWTACENIHPSPTSVGCLPDSCGPLCIPDTSLAMSKADKPGRVGWPLTSAGSRPAPPSWSPGQARAAAEAAGEDDP